MSLWHMVVLTLHGYQDCAATEPEPETGIVGTVFPETEIRTLHVGTVVQERNRNKGHSLKPC